MNEIPEERRASPGGNETAARADAPPEANTAEKLMLSFFVPGIPVAKGRPRFVRATGRTYTPAKTIEGERSIAQFAAVAMRGCPPFDHPIELHVVAVYSPPKTRTRAQRALPWANFKSSRSDVDNIVKAIFDAGNGVIWTDDALIASARVAKVYGDRPGLSVSVHALAAESWPFDATAEARAA